MPSCSTCASACQSWSSCSVTCGNGTRKRTNGRGCMDEETCTQPTCPDTTATIEIFQDSTRINSTVASTTFETSSATDRRKFTDTTATKGINQDSTRINSTVASTTFETSSATEGPNFAEPPVSSNSFQIVAITVPIVCVMLLILIVATVYLVRRQRNRKQPETSEQERSDNFQEAITPGTGYYNIGGQENDGGYYNVGSSVTYESSMENRRNVTPNSYEQPNTNDKENDQDVQDPDIVSQYEKLQQAIYQNNGTNDEPNRVYTDLILS